MEIKVKAKDIMLVAPDDSSQGDDDSQQDTQQRINVEQEPPKSKSKSEPKSSEEPPKDSKGDPNEDPEDSKSDKDSKDPEDQDTDKDSPDSKDQDTDTGSDKPEEEPEDNPDGDSKSDKDSKDPADGDKETENPDDPESDDGDTKSDKDSKDPEDQDGDPESGEGEPEDKDSKDTDTEDGDDSDTDTGDAEDVIEEPPKKDLDKLKSQLIDKIAKGSVLADMLDADADKDKHHLGSHDDQGLTDGDREDVEPDEENDFKDSLDHLDPEVKDQYLDDEINNLLDIESEMDQSIEAAKARRSDKEGKPSDQASLSDIFITDKTKIRFVSVMNLIDKWIKKLRGDPKEDEPEWRTDIASRRIPDLWGREMDSDPPEETTGKLLLFVFDVSGSMKPAAKLMAEVCSDIALKVTKNKTVDKIAMINFDGKWSSAKKFEPSRGIKDRMRVFLRLETGSNQLPVWRAVQHFIDTNKSLVSKLSGIIMVSDFEILDTFHIPDNIKKMKPSILAMNIPPKGYGDDNLKRFIKANPGFAIWGLTIDGKKITQANTMRVAKT